MDRGKDVIRSWTEAKTSLDRGQRQRRHYIVDRGKDVISEHAEQTGNKSTALYRGACIYSKVGLGFYRPLNRIGSPQAEFKANLEQTQDVTSRCIYSKLRTESKVLWRCTYSEPTDNKKQAFISKWMNLEQTGIKARHISRWTYLFPNWEQKVRR